MSDNKAPPPMSASAKPSSGHVGPEYPPSSANTTEKMQFPVSREPREGYEVDCVSHIDKQLQQSHLPHMPAVEAIPDENAVAKLENQEEEAGDASKKRPSACHRVLGLPELCIPILEDMNLWELGEAAQAGGPILEVIKGKPALAKQLCLQFGDDAYFKGNIFLFYDNMTCSKNATKKCDFHISPSSYLRWCNGSELPDMELHYPCFGPSSGEAERNSPIEIRTDDYEGLSKSLRSGGLYLDMLPGTEPAIVKLVVSNKGCNDHEKTHQDPPKAVNWKTAELMVRATHMKTMFRIAKKLFECADAMDKKLFLGELTEWSDETGIIANSPWKTFFAADELDFVVSDEPKYRWFWKQRPNGNIDEGCSFSDYCEEVHRERERH